MNKTISLLLALVMCLSLCACGSKDDPSKVNEASKTAETSQETEPPKETEAPEAVNLVLGETASFENFEITVTNFDFTAKAENPQKGKGGALIPSNGETVANIYFDVKYNGKRAISFPFFSCEVVYGDGYTFYSERIWFYDNGVDAWLNTGTIEPLTPKFGSVFSFFVPEEVRDNQENTLSVIFYTSSSTAPIAVYNVR